MENTLRQHQRDLLRNLLQPKGNETSKSELSKLRSVGKLEARYLKKSKNLNSLRPRNFTWILNMMILKRQCPSKYACFGYLC